MKKEIALRDPRRQRAALHQRPRRNRRSEAIRDLVAETRLSPADLILPLFVCGGKGERHPIAAMPGHHRLSRDLAVKLCKDLAKAGIPGVALFPVIENTRKDPLAKESLNPEGLLPSTIKAIKDAIPDLCVITDVAMDPYSTDGHDGIVREGRVINDESLDVLAGMALVQAQAGADYVAPSDMMDGRIGYLREALDQSGHAETGILSYAAKYASAFYGPFREALDSAPRFGDKKTYQMDPRNSREALREVDLDIRQGADIVMVKPALAYLDVIARVKARSSVPVAAYNVSGEYSMIKAAAANGWLDEKKAAMESLTAIKRAGADMIFTYWALEAMNWL